MLRLATPRWLAALLLAAALAQMASGQAPQTAPAPTPANITPEEEGDVLQAHQRYQAAIAAYQKELHPSAALWNRMGIAYQMLFNLKDATRCYKQSLKLDPHNASVYNNLGTVEDSQKQYGAAEKMYRKSLKLEPHSALVLKNLGTNLLLQGKYRKGWAVYKEAMAIDPQIFQTVNGPRVQNPTSVQERGAMNYYMALGCARQGQTACALDYLRMALNEGFTTAKKAAADAEFSTLRDDPGFKQLLAEQEQQKR